MATFRLKLVRPDAAHGGERAVERPDDIGDGDAVGGTGEQPPAIATADAADELTVAQLTQDVEEEARGHVVAFREDGAGDRPSRLLLLLLGDRGHHAYAVVDLVRDPHWPRPYHR